MSKYVRIIAPDETFELKVGDSKFFYRRLRAAEKNNIILKHTKRGEIDKTAATMEILKMCLKGWEGVKDSNGNDVKFTVDLIEALPETVLIQLELAAISAYGEEASPKN
jgi:hypothetical protein